MPDIIGIRFKSCGKIYHFDVNGIQVKEGDSVVLESDFGIAIGKVIRGPEFVEKSERDLKKVLRVVTDDDIKTTEENKKLEKDAGEFCSERIMARGLQMKFIRAESTLDRKRIVFYFSADGRIDFRELVKDLAAKFKTRIEMRQIGVRDEAKLIGGLGICGRELCCSAFLTSFDPVSIKMAKKQELALNVGKLSGLCSRLMCCLRYEYDGDIASISSDDEIPIGQEDVPIAAIEEKISMKKPERHSQSDKQTGGAVKEQIKSKAPAGQTPQAQQPAPKEGEGSRKDRPKGRRRRFRR